jgi:hypothetical protein
VTKWLALGLGLVALTAVVVVALPRGRHGADLLYAEQIPKWQVHRSAELRKADGPAAQAMLRTARGWPAVAAALSMLDQSYPDDVPDRIAQVNRAAWEAKLPYWLDAQTVKGRPVLLSYRVEGVATWRSEEKQVEVLRLRRLDNLNVELGLLGQSSSNGPLIFLDRIEDELVEELSKTPGTRKDGIEIETDKLLLSVGPKLDARDMAALTLVLRERRARFEAMENRMRVTVPRPSGLVWSDAWFSSLEPLTKFVRGRGPLVFDSDVRAVRQANQAVDRPSFQRLMAALIDLRAETVEAHEARHAIEEPIPTLPWFLQRHGNLVFADQINKELRAYLGELRDAPRGPCLSLVGLIRAAYASKARATPHFFAGKIIARSLGAANQVEAKGPGDDRASPGPLDEAFPDIEPAAFLRAQCAAPIPEARARVAKLWREFYEQDMPTLTRADSER